jgi:hypothetical protein
VSRDEAAHPTRQTLLAGQGDPASFFVDLQHADLHDLPDGDDFRRVLDEAIVQLRDMNESILVDADVHERSEIESHW